MKSVSHSARETVAILHNIRSEENVGSMFRTADAFGVSKIYLVGYTPGPYDRFGRVNTKVVKAALGAHETMQYEHVRNLKSLIKRLKREGFTVIAIEQDQNSTPCGSLRIKSSNVACIVGNEIVGIPHTHLEMCDAVVEIPMKGTKESLNVSVAFGVALFSLLNM